VKNNGKADVKAGPAGERDANGRWLPGVSGNLAGGRGASVKAAYLRALGLPADGKNLDRTQADALAQAIINGALSGDVAAAREVRQATEGDALNVTERTFEVEFDRQIAIADIAPGSTGDRNGSGRNGSSHNGA